MPLLVVEEEEEDVVVEATPVPGRPPVRLRQGQGQRVPVVVLVVVGMGVVVVRRRPHPRRPRRPRRRRRLARPLPRCPLPWSRRPPPRGRQRRNPPREEGQSGAGLLQKGRHIARRRWGAWRSRPLLVMADVLLSRQMFLRMWIHIFLLLPVVLLHRSLPPPPPGCLEDRVEVEEEDGRQESEEE